MVYVDDMKQQPSTFRAEVPRLAADATDEEFDSSMEALPPCPGIRSIDGDEAEGDAASLAEFEAGGGVPHEIVSAWLNTWGTPDRRPFWEWYASRDG